jgi:hypothetical protein
MARRKLPQRHYPDQPELAARADLAIALGIETPTAPYWTLDNDDVPPWYSLPRAVERLREQVEGIE